MRRARMRRDQGPLQLGVIDMVAEPQQLVMLIWRLQVLPMREAPPLHAPPHTFDRQHPDSQFTAHPTGKVPPGHVNVCAPPS